MVFVISGDPMYLIEGTPNQTHQSNIDSLHEPSDPEIFFINSTIRPLHTKMPRQNCDNYWLRFPTAIPLQPLLFTPPPLLTNVFNNISNQP